MHFEIFELAFKKINCQLTVAVINTLLHLIPILCLLFKKFQKDQSSLTFMESFDLEKRNAGKCQLKFCGFGSVENQI